MAKKAAAGKSYTLNTDEAKLIDAVRELKRAQEARKAANDAADKVEELFDAIRYSDDDYDF